MDENVVGGGGRGGFPREDWDRRGCRPWLLEKQNPWGGVTLAGGAQWTGHRYGSAVSSKQKVSWKIYPQVTKFIVRRAEEGVH